MILDTYTEQVAYSVVYTSIRMRTSFPLLLDGEALLIWHLSDATSSHFSVEKELTTSTHSKGYC